MWCDKIVPGESITNAMMRGKKVSATKTSEDWRNTTGKQASSKRIKTCSTVVDGETIYQKQGRKQSIYMKKIIDGKTNGSVHADKAAITKRNDIVDGKDGFSRASIKSVATMRNTIINVDGIPKTKIEISAAKVSSTRRNEDWKNTIGKESIMKRNLTMNALVMFEGVMITRNEINGKLSSRTKRKKRRNIMYII